MSWGDGLKAGIEKAAESGVAILPYAANVGLRAVVFSVYEALPPQVATGAPAIREKLARLHVEMGYNSVEPDPLDDSRARVLSNLVHAYRPETIDQGPGQLVTAGSAAGSYLPMPPMSWDAPAAPLAKRAGDAIEEAYNWAKAHPGAAPELLSDLKESFAGLWDWSKDQAAAAAAAGGGTVSEVFGPMSEAAEAAKRAASQFVKWAGLALVGGAALWLATKRGGGKAGDPWA